jgi:hypothetical protein
MQDVQENTALLTLTGVGVEKVTEISRQIQQKHVRRK